MHEDYNELFQWYIDGEIDPLEKIILEEHLLSCRECRRELNQLKLMDWELKHQPAIDVPVAELAACRQAALEAFVAEKKEPQGSGSMAKDLWRLQLQIMQHTSSFVGFNPVQRTLNRTVKRSFSLLGRAVGSAIRKRNPLLSRFSPGRS